MQVHLPDELHKQLKAHAASLYMPLSSALAQAVIAYLAVKKQEEVKAKKAEPKPPKPKRSPTGQYYYTADAPTHPSNGKRPSLNLRNAINSFHRLTIRLAGQVDPTFIAADTQFVANALAEFNHFTAEEGFEWTPQNAYEWVTANPRTKEEVASYRAAPKPAASVEKTLEERYAEQAAIFQASMTVKSEPTEEPE